MKTIKNVVTQAVVVVVVMALAYYAARAGWFETDADKRRTTRYTRLAKDAEDANRVLSEFLTTEREKCTSKKLTLDQTQMSVVCAPVDDTSKK